MVVLNDFLVCICIILNKINNVVKIEYFICFLNVGMNNCLREEILNKILLNYLE